MKWSRDWDGISFAELRELLYNGVIRRYQLGGGKIPFAPNITVMECIQHFGAICKEKFDRGLLDLNQRKN